MCTIILILRMYVHFHLENVRLLVLNRTGVTLVLFTLFEGIYAQLLKPVHLIPLVVLL